MWFHYEYLPVPDPQPLLAYLNTTDLSPYSLDRYAVLSSSWGHYNWALTINRWDTLLAIVPFVASIALLTGAIILVIVFVILIGMVLWYLVPALLYLALSLAFFPIAVIGLLICPNPTLKAMQYLYPPKKTEEKKPSEETTDLEAGETAALLGQDQGPDNKTPPAVPNQESETAEIVPEQEQETPETEAPPNHPRRELIAKIILVVLHTLAYSYCIAISTWEQLELRRWILTQSYSSVDTSHITSLWIYPVLHIFLGTFIILTLLIFFAKTTVNFEAYFTVALLILWTSTLFRSNKLALKEEENEEWALSSHFWEVWTTWFVMTSMGWNVWQIWFKGTERVGRWRARVGLKC